jgi:hypothetical protein
MEMIDHRFKDPVLRHVGHGVIGIEGRQNKTRLGRAEKMDGIALDPSLISFNIDLSTAVTFALAMPLTISACPRQNLSPVQGGKTT